MLSLTSYLLITIALGLSIGSIYFHEEHGGDGFMGFLFAAVAIILWPLALSAAPIVFLIINLKNKYDETFNRVRRQLSLESKTTYEDNHAVISVASTPNLKMALRGARLGKIPLKSNQIEIIKQELINRAAENSLLK